MQTDSVPQPESGSKRKRSSRACDNCKGRRSKCEDIRENDSRVSCLACRKTSQKCSFTLPVRKRGPPRGVQLSSDRTPPEYEHEPQWPTDPRPPSPVSTLPGVSAGTRRSYEGVSDLAVDRLLVLYWINIHSVWPLVYRPEFKQPPKHLFLSMLAAASCTASEADGIPDHDADSLFQLANRAVLERRHDHRIDVIQSLMLLSLRQSSCGDKRSAAMYAGRASLMCLTLGLNLAPVGNITPSEREVRARVFWNCYVLDKTIAEETGRPYLLPCRRSSTPFPNLNEIDELETWPPLPLSLAPLPFSVRHVAPRRGHVISCFVWTCRLAMIVEDILDLEAEGPDTGNTGVEFDREFLLAKKTRMDEGFELDRLAKQLDSWRAALPASLGVDTFNDASPLPHHIVNLAWYHASRIRLHSRSLASPLPSILNPAVQCSEAAQHVVGLLEYLERYHFLQPVGSDLMHVLSITTLFLAFEATSGDLAIRDRAKAGFAQCSAWLREFTQSWPADSANKVLLEGLIRGGLHISGPTTSDQPQSAEALVESSPSGALRPPTVTDGLHSVRKYLSRDSETAEVSMYETQTGLRDLLQLPQYYWNYLSAPPPATLLPTTETLYTGGGEFDNSSGLWNQAWLSDIGASQIGASVQPQDCDSSWRPPMGGASLTLADGNSSRDLMSPSAFSAQMPAETVDQTAMYDALMSFMLGATKGS